MPFKNLFNRLKFLCRYYDIFFYLYIYQNKQTHLKNKIMNNLKNLTISEIIGITFFTALIIGLVLLSIDTINLHA